LFRASTYSFEEDCTRSFFADKIDAPIVELDREYENIEYFGCEGRKEGNKLILSPIHAFEFAFINAK
jgi:hypothetical protein